MAENVLIGIIAIIVGFLIGFFLRGLFFKASEAEIRVRKQLEETENEFSAYRRKTGEHLSSVSELLETMQKSCESAKEQIFSINELTENTRRIGPVEMGIPPKDYPSHS